VDSAGHALTWNGVTWSEPVALPVALGQAAGLAGVSCPSGLFCAAVDDGSNAFVGRA
jgi:hypothetical protein